MENFLLNNRAMSAKDWAIDGAVALGAFLFGCFQLMLTASSIVIPDLALRQYLGEVNIIPDMAVFVGLALTTVPLVARRKTSWPVFVFSAIVFLGLQGAFPGFSLSVIGPAVALYTLAHERGLTEALVAAALMVAGLLFAQVPSRTASLVFFTKFQNIAFVAAAVFAGYAYRTHKAYVLATEQRAREAEHTREEETARRVEEERVRIAREVHDITAHSLSAVSIQAAAAQRMMDHDPAAAKEAIATVRSTAKSALEEIRSMIGVLRQGDAAAETEPTMGTDHLPELVEYLERAGLAVSFDEAGYHRETTPAYIDRALYGIAREAATNTVRHAQASKVTIRLESNAREAHLVVEDDGVGAAVFAGVTPVSPGAQTDGHGIQGMEERVKLLRGTFTAASRAERGFRIEARIPQTTGKDAQ